MATREYYFRSYMKIRILLLAAFLASNAWGYYEDPHAPFPAKNNFTNQSLIAWRYVANVQEACEKESRSRGLGGFGYALEACSFWSSHNGQDQCTIVTSANPNFHTVGHEIRHCFQGSFHK